MLFALIIDANYAVCSYRKGDKTVINKINRIILLPTRYYEDTCKSLPTLISSLFRSVIFHYITINVMLNPRRA